MTVTLRDQIASRIRDLHPQLVERRRDFHQHPELGFQEFRTSKIVADWLTELGLEVRTGVAKTGVVARLRGGKPGKTIALRADMDALPIQDVKTCDYKSTVPGTMHACGHDAHTTMVLGAATVLSELRDQLEGDVVFLFQPAEEGPGGAEPMIAEGALDGVDFILGQHMAPVYPAGYMAVAEREAMAAADEFTLRILGTGGHGAYPHMTVDALQISAQVITALQAVVSRQVDPLQSAVLTIGTINGGYRYNVIADVIEMTGTVRTFDGLLREEIPKRMEQIIDGITKAYGASYELDYQFHYPAVLNHKSAVDLMRSVATDVLGRERVLEAPPSMGGEDFAYFLQKVPGCFYWLGCKHPDPVHVGYNIHHPGFDIEEESLFYGVQLMVEGTLAYLKHNK
ncbi:amidohydrolase [Tumebacillus sp. ITR2]|uniref:Amidohydrolase n=1 Tax=Tumebacillus amylolyticus TaxID=2801339 RepID=A0ABS1JGC5_9BACL|nr:amidohydrolase [Tumebacillus amylolyticus]MBL0389333.1 amidohydrolase [Tumebacillus amylolyticus]